MTRPNDVRVPSAPGIALCVVPGWDDYELLDSGEGAKLERFGRYTFVRPESQAAWRRGLPEDRWREADGEFHASSAGDRGVWRFRGDVADRWPMGYDRLRFWARATPFRHLGVFPEQAAQWDWIAARVRHAGRPVRLLNLFGYTGIATLAAAAAGAHVTHVDASKRTVTWAKDNQALSSLTDHSVRWIVDDVLAFVSREVRRGARYDGFVIDPPRMGRGPDGEQWRVEQGLPALLERCRRITSDSPLLVCLTMYAIRFSAISLHNVVQEFAGDLGGSVTAGEMAVRERSAGRVLSSAIFARWSAGGERD